MIESPGFAWLVAQQAQRTDGTNASPEITWSIPGSRSRQTNTDLTFLHGASSRSPPKPTICRHVNTQGSGRVTLTGADNLSRTYQGSGAGLAEEIAAKLIAKIIRLLVDSRESSGDNRGLRLELETFRTTLTLTRLVIQVYEHTPLGRNLANTIVPELEQCCLELQESFNKIDNCRQEFSSISTPDLWEQIWWMQREKDELSSLRTKLRARQKSLGSFLMALNS